MQESLRSPFQGYLNIRLGRFLRLFYKAVQQDHVAVAHAKNHAANPVAAEVAAHLPQAVAGV